MTTEVKPTYSPGLDGVIAGESGVCHVDPNAGLLYRGYDIDEMAARASFEEVAYLLLIGELPTSAQLAQFKRDLAEQRDVPDAIVSMLALLPKGAHPMDALRTGVSMLASYDPELNDASHEANLRKSTRLLAKIPTIVTAAFHVANGRKPIAGKKELGLSANFLYCLDGKIPEPWKEKLFDTVLNLYAEHEYNAGTFAARVTASTMADIYAAIVTGIGTLKGPLHGGANEEAMKMLVEIATPERAEPWVKERLARKDKIMGFGHRVYKKGDSRVPVMRELARDLGKRVGQPQWVAICETLDAVMEREKKLFANLDLYAAPVFYMLGNPAELNTPIFAISRVSGWCAHVVEQQDRNRIIRPRCLYNGPTRRAYPNA